MSHFTASFLSQASKFSSVQSFPIMSNARYISWFWLLNGQFSLCWCQGNTDTICIFPPPSYYVLCIAYYHNHMATWRWICDWKYFQILDVYRIEMISVDTPTLNEGHLYVSFRFIIVSITISLKYTCWYIGISWVSIHAFSIFTV